MTQSKSDHLPVLNQSFTEKNADKMSVRMTSNTSSIYKTYAKNKLYVCLLNSF
jgi:hypothetical protein